MEKTVQIYYTSDTHGHIFPVNYAANCSEKSGLLNLADQMEKDGNTLVLDGGDSLQGTPLTQYYLENRGRWPVHPVAAAFNAMGLDYFTLGKSTFDGCTSLAAATLPEGLQSIGEYAFQHCSALTSIKIPGHGENRWDVFFPRLLCPCQP